MTQPPAASQVANGTAHTPLRRQVATLGRRTARFAALRVIGFIVARPRLDAFLRRQIYRFPGLAGRARAAIARSRRADGQALPPIVSEEADLTDSARQILRDLARVIDHTPPS